MKIYDYFLASDQLEGRNLPSRGFDTAALYVASHLAEWGLKPGGSTAKTNGPLQPYFAPMELVSRQIIPEETKASITTPPAARGGGGGGGRNGGAGGTKGGTKGGNAAAAPGDAAAPGNAATPENAATPGNAAPRTTELAYTKDWTVAAGGRGAPPIAALELSASLVFVGNGYVIEKTKNNPYEGLDVHGNIVVVAGVPPELAAQQNTGGRGGRGGGGGRGAAKGGAQGGAAATPTEITPITPPAANDAAAPETPAAAGLQRSGRGAAAAPNPLGENCIDLSDAWRNPPPKNGALAVVTVREFPAIDNDGECRAGGGYGAQRESTVPLSRRPAWLRRSHAIPACPRSPRGWP